MRHGAQDGPPTWIRPSVSLVVAVLLAGCGGDEDKNTNKDRPSGGRTATATAPPPPAPPAASSAADMRCNGRAGVEIPAVEIPEVTIPAVHERDRRLDGHVVDGFDIAEVRIAAPA